MSADTRGMSLQTQAFPQKITTLFWFVTTEAMGNLSVNWTRGHSVHKWLLVWKWHVADPLWMVSYCVDQWTCRQCWHWYFCTNLPVQTWATLGASLKFIWTSQEGYTLPCQKRPVWPVLQAGFWFSILNDSAGISGTTWTSLQPEEWLTSRLHTPSPLSTNKEMPAPTKPVSNVHNL